MTVEETTGKYKDVLRSPVGPRFFATRMWFDISKARDGLGYVPPVTTGEAVAENGRWAAERLRIS